METMYPHKSTLLDKFWFGEICFVIPSSVTPAQSDQALKQATQQVTKTITTDNAKAGFSLEIGVEMPYDIDKLESPTHKINTKKTHSKATVQLSTKTDRLEQNFVLLVGLAEAHAPRMWVEVDEAGHHASMVWWEYAECPSNFP